MKHQHYDNEAVQGDIHIDIPVYTEDDVKGMSESEYERLKEESTRISNFRSVCHKADDSLFNILDNYRSAHALDAAQSMADAFNRAYSNRWLYAEIYGGKGLAMYVGEARAVDNEHYSQHGGVVIPLTYISECFGGFPLRMSTSFTSDDSEIDVKKDIITFLQNHCHDTSMWKQVKFTEDIGKCRGIVDAMVEKSRELYGKYLAMAEHNLGELSKSVDGSGYHPDLKWSSLDKAWEGMVEK